MKKHRSTLLGILPAAIALMAAIPRSAAQAPSVETLPATDMLNGTASPTGAATTVWFEWGATTAYGNSTAEIDAGNGTVAMPIATTATGLVANLSYHYRIAASNSSGTAYGADALFGIWQLDDINLADSGAGSLREVIAGAPAGSAIVLTNSGTLVLTSGELAINKDLTITGPGADLLAISGNHSSRVFNIGESNTVAISGLAIRNGRGANGAYGSYTGAPGGPGDSGGGIYNAGNLTLTECAVTMNQAGWGGAGRSGHYSSKISGGNGGSGGHGGGIHNPSTGTLVLRRCTLSGNSSGLEEAAVTAGPAMFRGWAGGIRAAPAEAVETVEAAGQSTTPES